MFMTVISGVKFTCYFEMNSQFVPFSQEINVGDSLPLVPGVQGFSWKLIGFYFKSTRKPVLEGKIGGKIHM